MLTHELPDLALDSVLLEEIRSVQWWSVLDGDGEDGYDTFCDTGGNGSVRFFSRQELSSVHPHFPAVIEHLHGLRGAPVEGRRIQAALQFWLQGYTLTLPREAIVDLQGKPTNEDLRVGELAWLEVKDEMASVAVGFKSYHFMKTPGGKVFADRLTDRQTRLSQDWMNTHLPGWRTRLLAARALDLAAEQCAAMVLVTNTTKSSLPAALPSTGFGD